MLFCCSLLQAPPHVPSPIPWLGNIVAFGERPVDFLLESMEKVRRLATPSPAHDVVAARAVSRRVVGNASHLLHNRPVGPGLRAANVTCLSCMSVERALEP